MKITKKILGTAAFLMLFLGTVFAGENTVPTGKDTVSAYIMNGTSYQIDDVRNFDMVTIEEYRDSMVNMGAPVELINQLNMYISVAHKTEDQVVLLIDSLFELDEIPISLINQIKFYVSIHPNGQYAIIVEDTSFYPAQCYYNKWNTKVPFSYSKSLSNQDSVLKLVLNGRGKSNGFVMPVQNTLTSRFGWRDGRSHKGIDIDLEVWDPVKCAFPGMVRVAKYYRGYGRVVVVRHFNGLETLYAHLHRLKVKPGQSVEAGDVIGLGGSSGHSTGSHLHFECRFKGIPLDPLSFIDHKGEKLESDTLILKKTKWGYASYPEGTKFYSVRRGDCLYDIAKLFGVTANRLAHLNNIRRNSILQVGQTLRVL